MTFAFEDKDEDDPDFGHESKRKHFNIKPILIVTIVLIVLALLLYSVYTLQSSNQQYPLTYVPPTNSSNMVLLGGSNIMVNVTQYLAKAYNTLNPNTHIVVQDGGDSAGEIGVGSGAIDIGYVSDQAYLLAAQQSYPSENIQGAEVGGSGIVVIEGTNLVDDGGNPLSFTHTALHTIFPTSGPVAGIWVNPGQGTSVEINSINYTVITNATTDLRIQAASPGAGWIQINTYVIGSGIDNETTSVFAQYLGDNSPSSIVSTVQTAEQSDTDMLAAIQSDPNGLGFIDYGVATSNNIVVSNISIAGISNSDPATTLNEFAYGNTGTVSANASVSHTDILNALKGVGSYPSGWNGTSLARTFWFLTAGTPNSLEQAFIQFCQSPNETIFWNQNGFDSMYYILH